MKTNVQAHWHPFHEMSLPLGWVDYRERKRVIRLCKPPREHAVRFKYFKRVRGKLPEELEKVARSCVYLSAHSPEAQAHIPAILALHAKECGCPWTPTNNNILLFKKRPRRARRPR